MLSDLLCDLPRDITCRLRAEVRPRACKPAEPQPWCAASVAAGSKVMQTSENETYTEYIQEGYQAGAKPMVQRTYFSETQVQKSEYFAVYSLSL